jgi:hypothetical protein
MNRYAQVVLLALLIVLASVSLRRATAAVLGSEWKPSFSTSDGTLSSTLPPVPVGIGGSPMPPKLREVTIGGSPMPPKLAIGGSPMPPKLREVAIGGSPMPPK